MPRKRIHRTDLPTNVRHKHGAYYFIDSKGKWNSLGKEYSAAMAAWAQIVQRPTKTETFGELLDRYLLEIVPRKAPRTQADNRQEAGNLRVFFGAMACEAILPEHIAQYRDARTAKTRGNREIALLSHVFTTALDWGIVKYNPATGVRRNSESGRTRYITDDELETFSAMCSPQLQVYIALKNITAIRKSDLLAIKWSDINSEGMNVWVSKTKQRMRFLLTTELSALIQTLSKRCEYLFVTTLGTPLSLKGFNSAWQRKMAVYVSNGGERFTEHDIRGKVATDSDALGQDAQKLLGHKTYAMTERYIKQRKTDIVEPLRRKK